MMALFILIFFTAYLAGSINFSILALKLAGKKDPRTHSSKNPGATNVYRQEGIQWALLVLLLDMARAMGIAFAAVYFVPGRLVPWIGFGLILGNRFPVFHGFRGGKGVANYLGFTVVVSPVFTGLGVMAWAVVFRIWRIPFLSSFALVGFLATGTIVSQNGHLIGISGVLCTACFIVWCHHTNIVGWLKQKRR